MKSDKVITRRKKSGERRNSGQISKAKDGGRATGDMFTLLIRQQLGVECVKEHRFHPKRMWRFDYAIPNYRIALEVEGGVWTGGRHVRAQGFLGDVAKYNAAALLGWRVFRCTPSTLYKTATIDLLRCALVQPRLPECEADLCEK